MSFAMSESWCSRHYLGGWNVKCRWSSWSWSEDLGALVGWRLLINVLKRTGWVVLKRTGFVLIKTGWFVLKRTWTICNFRRRVELNVFECFVEIAINFVDGFGVELVDGEHRCGVDGLVVFWDRYQSRWRCVFLVSIGLMAVSRLVDFV